MNTSQRALSAKFSEALKHSGAPIRRSFTDAQDNELSPLASLMRGSRGQGGGGRGGGTRLAVLLTLLWVLRAGHHDSDRPARFWAQLIGLNEPKTDGARAVRDSFHELAKRKLITVDSVIPGTLLIQLLREDGTGIPYSSPVASQVGGAVTEPYFRIPPALWETGLISELSGPGLAMFVIVMRSVRSDRPQNKLWFSSASFKERYSLGDSTRKSGLRELVEHGVLIESYESVDDTGGTEYRTRRRKTYTVDPAYLPFKTNEVSTQKS
ncbi:hypothetical protein [Glutamicibacter sp. BW77]|uniref:hypothetical protein n=1 Tax=Glutamicibacter sp. BW77 TaxID=2024402 RepID=UPI0011423F48|nr:hypothetical protein [Glutamicibacter sp. BW77]